MLRPKSHFELELVVVRGTLTSPVGVVVLALVYQKTGQQEIFKALGEMCSWAFASNGVGGVWQGKMWEVRRSHVKCPSMREFAIGASKHESNLSSHQAPQKQ